MHNMYKYLAMGMLVWLTVWHLPILHAEPRMVCPDGNRPYFGVCPGGKRPVRASGRRNDSRPPPVPPTTSERPQAKVGHCNASRRPGRGKSDCPSKKIVTPVVTPMVTPAVETTTHTESLISGRYRDNGNGTVTDVTTNLMWKRCAEGQSWTGSTCAGEGTEITWDDAMDISWMHDPKQRSWGAFAAYDDWRVPTIENLRTLVYCSSGKPKTWNDTSNCCKGKYNNPTIDLIAFPNAQNAWFWSSSTAESDSPYAWYLNFEDGNSNNFINRSNAYRVRLVRGGQ